MSHAVSNCIACKANSFMQRIPAGRPAYAYRCCRHCGLGEIDPKPAGDAEVYDRGYFVNGGGRAGYDDYDADEYWHRRTARHRLARVVTARGPLPDRTPPSVVDVGTATGFFPDEARSAGWRAYAVERSEWAAARTRSRGIRTEPDLTAYADLAPSRTETGLDAVTFFQVLEHLDDPAAALRQAADLLTPGGIVVCETWDADSRTARAFGTRWQQLSPPSVLWLFTADSAGRLVERAGLQRVSWRPTVKAVSLATVAGQALGNRLPDLARPIARRVALPYAFDDLVTFVAVKR